MTLTRRLYAFVAVVVLSLSLFVGSAVSQDAEPGSGLSISPTRTELTIEPGKGDKFSLRVRNVTNNNIVATPVANDFISDDDTGQPKLIINEERDDLPSIRPFLPTLEDVTLKPGEAKTVEIEVSIPTDTSAGGYYGIIRYIAVPEGAEGPDLGQVSLTASVSSILLIEVPGNITEQIQLRDVLFYRKGVAGTFFTSRAEEVGVQIVNQGNSFAKPFGKVLVKNPFGKEIMNYEMNTGNPKNNVLPESTRAFRESLQGVSLPGRYTVTASISFGNGSELLTLSNSFWYLPWWFLILFILLVAAIGAGIYFVRQRINTGSFKAKKPAPKKKSGK